MTFQAGALLPAARVTDLVTTETADATLVYDLTRHELHQLNPIASTIWGLLNGKRTATDVLVAARAELGPDLTIESVQLALATLAEANLLAEPVESSTFTAGQSRRRFLKKAGIVSIPAIVSITAPFAVAHASSSCPAGGTPYQPNKQCYSYGSVCCNPDPADNYACGPGAPCGTCQFWQWNCQSGYYMQPSNTYQEGEVLYSNGQPVQGGNSGQCQVSFQCR